MKVPVLTAAAGAGWEAALVGALAQGSHGISVARRCVDVVDLLAVAAAGQAQAALVAAELRRFDADAVDRLVAAGVVPVGVVARGDASAEARMRASGVAHIVPADADPDTVSSVVTSAVFARSDQRRFARAFGDPLAGLPSSAPGPTAPTSHGPTAPTPP
ncbi:MAG: chromosome partitioning protein, partial [Actinomycetota bacterium]|nr:chromosome partitioning protein [Actinomycetota bacterium]